jgi:hypothetical protein
MSQEFCHLRQMSLPNFFGSPQPWKTRARNPPHRPAAAATMALVGEEVAVALVDGVVVMQQCEHP